jgi:predicted Zn-dependent peptidase
VTNAVPQDLVFPDEAFRGHEPVAGAPRPFHLPPIQQFTLAAGIEVYLVEQHLLPVVSIDLNFDGGSAVDPPGKEGLASICMAMLTEGTEQLDKLAYAERLADTASSIGGYAADESIGVTLSSLRKHLDPTLAQLIDTIRAPGFRASDFDRLVKRRIENIRSRRNPAAIASRVAGPVLYGRSHPFGAVTTEASLAAISLDDCRAFAAAWLRPERARLFVVGDLTVEQICAYFDSPRLAGWTGAAPAVPEVPAPAMMPGRIFFVDVPGATQSSVSYLQFGPQRTAAEYFATSLAGAVFGGGFTSRINMNLREDKGYSYGARGGFSYSRSYGVFSASAQVVGNATYQSILEIDREVRGMWAGAPPFAITPDELEREKNAAILGLPGRFATAQAALGQYRGLVYFGLPLDYYHSYVERITAVSLSEVRTAATRHLRPGQAVYVVVGNGEQPMIARVQDAADRSTASGPPPSPPAETGPLAPDSPRSSKQSWIDVPYVRNGYQLTLRDALADLAERGDVGSGGLVELDGDGVPK